MRLMFALVVAALVSAGTAGDARQATPPSQAPKQQPSQTPVFKSNIVIARLDIEAFDKSGKPVTDLQQGDFTVFENGVRQDVRTFSREELKPEALSLNAPPALVRGLPPDPVAPRTRRVFLIVFGAARLPPNPMSLGLGWGYLQGPSKAFDGALSFIRGRLLPQDLVSVMAFNRATDLTTNHEQVAQVVERLKLRYDGLSGDIGQYYVRTFVQGHITEDIPASIQAEIDAAFQPPGAPDEHMRSATSMILGTDVFRKLDDVPWQRPWNKMVVDMDLLKVYAGIEYLRHVDGEKHLICLRNGDFTLDNLPYDNPFHFFINFRLHNAQDDARLAARANDARVVVDIIHTTGMPAGGRNQAVISSSEDIAEFTGGQFAGMSYADAALGRIDEATRSGYILGYTPSNPALDDKYRNVTVKVNRPGVTALFRHGYTAQADVAPLDLREVLTSSRLKAAEATDVDSHDIKLAAKAVAVSAVGPARQIRVDLTIDASRLSLTQAGDRHVGTIDLDIFCGDAKQKIVGSLKQKMDMSLDEDHYQRALKDGIPYTVAVPVTAAAAHVKVFVYDYGADLLGTASVAVK